MRGIIPPQKASLHPFQVIWGVKHPRVNIHFSSGRPEPQPPPSNEKKVLKSKQHPQQCLQGISGWEARGGGGLGSGRFPVQPRLTWGLLGMSLHLSGLSFLNGTMRAMTPTPRGPARAPPPETETTRAEGRPPASSGLPAPPPSPQPLRSLGEGPRSRRSPPLRITGLPGAGPAAPAHGPHNGLTTREQTDTPTWHSPVSKCGVSGQRAPFVSPRLLPSPAADSRPTGLHHQPPSPQNPPAGATRATFRLSLCSCCKLFENLQNLVFEKKQGPVLNGHPVFLQ